MQSEKFSPQDSLQLIQQMIAKTRHDMGDNAVYFLLWGWVIFACCIGEFVLANLLSYEKHYLVWLLIIPAALASVYIGMRQNRSQKTNTYVGDSMKYLWTGMGISFFVLSVIFNKQGNNYAVFPVFIMLYGLGTFVSGKILQFKPLVYGGVAAWLMAMAAVFFDPQYQLLFGAASILVSYIIPAHLLRNKQNQSSNS